MLVGNRVRPLFIAIAMVLVISLTSVHLALAEYQSVYGGLGGVNTSGYYETGNWKATAYSNYNYSGVTVIVNSRGFNNSGGWHYTGSTSCSGDASCSAVAFSFDAANNQPPSSYRYATTQHTYVFSDGSDDFYTSSTGSQSSYLCYIYPACTSP